MLYSYNQLQGLNMTATRIPLSRYLYKFQNQRKEIKKLKAHEKDFLFRNLYILRNEKDEKCFDLSTIDEASEYYFNKLILIYTDNLNFNKPTRNPLGQTIDAPTMEKDKAYFEVYYGKWVTLIDSKKGKYLNVIYTELHRKLKELHLVYEEGGIGEADYNYHVKYLYIIAFFIYYKVKLFFDGLHEKYVLLNVFGKNIVLNIYSYVHTLFRHYIPSSEIGNMDRSINEPIPFLDVENLPYSIKDFLSLYFNYDKSPLTNKREYLLFSYKEDKYIVWLKYRKLEELNNDFGFEFRTLYKCKEQRDLVKFNDLSVHKVKYNLSFYF